MFRYILLEEKLESSELVQYRSFGIKVVDGDGCEIMSVSDVSVNKDLVEEICKLCNEHQLYPIHLFDIIEDRI